MKLILPGEFTTLNEYINAERGNKFHASKIKQEETDRVVWECRIQRLDLVKTGRFFLFVWYSKNTRKDPDNIAFSKKFILDGMYQSGIIFNDTQEYVKGFMDVFKIDKENPRVEVTTWVSLKKAISHIQD